MTLPPNLMRAADIKAYEAVQVWNITRGTRLETYAIEGTEGSLEICANGAAAHLIRPGDVVIVATFAYLTEEAVEQRVVVPRVVFVDSQNRMLRLGQEIPGPQRRGEPANTADSLC